MEKSMKKSIFITIVLFVLSITLTACGEKGPVTSFEVNMTEFTFLPSEFTVPAAEEITITATNNGAVTHEYVIFKLGTSPGDHFDQDEDEPKIYWELEVAPGGEVTTTFIAPSEPGEYYVTCRTEGHIEAGMIGRLYVVAAGE
jgi:uncharacterized cupredoxin-like copper-binding protein